MRSKRTVVLSFVALWLSGVLASGRPAAPVQDFPPPPSQITSALAAIPPDFVGIPTQSNFDLYSWLIFIALNWPADTTTCAANVNGSILDGGSPTVWETWLTDTDVFVASGSTPAPWCQQPEARLARYPARVRELAKKTGVTRVFGMIAKARPLVNSRFQGIDEAVGGVLTDQNGRFVRYDVHMNQDEYNYVVNPTGQSGSGPFPAVNLWSQSGQNMFTSTVSFPVGPSSYGPTGAIEVKAAWKVLSQKEIDSKRFYMTQAIVFNNAAGAPSPGKNPVTLGLVGLHISHKTKTESDWIWSTFEHVDNTTSSFYNPACPISKCVPNKQTAAKPYTELSASGKPLNQPVQVARVTPIEVGPVVVNGKQVNMNTYFQGLLQGSVWANYELVGTQWVGEAGTSPKPAVLANTTLETFIQPTSSCISCHKSATLASGKGSADFSFLLMSAQ